MAQCMAMGQAAGVTAALAAAQTHGLVREAPLDKVRADLLAGGAILESPQG